VMARTHPYLFSLSATESRHLRNFVYWARDKGFLKGKKIGLYYSSRTIYKTVIQKNVAGTLKRLGYSIAATVETANERGGPEDVVAVQRFQRAGVNLAMLFHSKMGFMQQAEAQRYKPQYIDSDYFFGTSDAATSTYPADQFDRTFAITGRRVGEIPAGARMDAEQAACFNNFKRYTGKNPPPDKTEWSYVMYSCDEAKILHWGLKNAGRNLNVSTFVQALETIRNMPLNRYMPISYSATKHHGGDFQRTLQWFGRDNECHCWKAVGPIRPYYVS
jgi:substrate-binding family protein